MLQSQAAHWPAPPRVEDHRLSDDHDYGPREAALILRDLANPCRLAVLAMLCEGEYAVGALEARMDMSQSALSQHLARLRRGQLVRTRREQQKIFYSLATPELAPLIRQIARSCAHLCAETRGTARPRVAAYATAAE